MLDKWSEKKMDFGLDALLDLNIDAGVISMEAFITGVLKQWERWEFSMQL